MVNMFADPVTMIGGLVQVRTDMHTGRCSLNMPADQVQQYQAFLLVGVN